MLENVHFQSRKLSWIFHGLHLQFPKASILKLTDLTKFCADSNSRELSAVWVRVRITLRLAVYRQLVCLGAKSLEIHDQYFFSTGHFLSDERMGLSFITAVGPRQRRHSQVRVPLDSWALFTVSDSRLPQPGRPGPRIYIPQEQGGPVIPPGTGFPFVASYDSQGYGWSLRPRLHTGIQFEKPCLRLLCIWIQKQRKPLGTLLHQRVSRPYIPAF
jgi:hypothetical protein